MVISRYIITEISKPLVLGTLLLVMVFIGFSSAIKLGDASSGLIDPSIVLQLIALKTIISMEVLLPTALYLSIIAALGRLYHDSEMAALSAAGVSEIRIMASVLFVAVCVAILVGYISLYARPWSYQLSYQLESQAVAQFDIRKIEPGQFTELQGSKYVLHAEKVDQDTGELGQVFLQSDVDSKTQIIYAQHALLAPVRSGEARSFEFFDGYGYLLDRFGNHDKTLKFEKLIVHLPKDEPSSRYRRKAESTVVLFHSDNPKEIAEFQWRLSTPVATLLLALLAVPLSRSQPRQGSHGNFFIAILLYAGLFNLISVARTWLEDGKVPPMPGLWWAYGVPALLLVWLMAKPAWDRRSRT